MKSNIIKAMLAGALLLTPAFALLAQTQVPATPFGALVYGSQNINLEDNQAVEMYIPTYARYDFAVSSKDWIKPTATRYGVTFSVDENLNATSRKAVLSLRSSEGVSTTWNIFQPGLDIASSAEATVAAGYVIPVRSKDAAKKTEGKAQGSDPLTNSYDGDINTLYHSNYNAFDPNDPDQWPVLEYYFTEENAPASETVEIASIIYQPRVSGGQNGRFGKLAIEIGIYDATDGVKWTPLQEDLFDFKMSDKATTVAIPAEKQTGIRAIRFIVHTGDENGAHPGKCFASCAEMQFAKPAKANPDMEKFTDELCSKLKEGTTQADIDAMTDPFLKQLAQLMFDGTYSSENLVSSHDAIKSVATLAEEMQTGKQYDQTAGVTGVALTPGKYVIIVSGIPESKGTVEMRYTRWHGHEQYKNENDNDVSWHCQESTYNLRNGINIVTINQLTGVERRTEGDDMGLVYINNFDDEAAAAGLPNTVSVHVVGGIYNGILSADKTNAEMQEILNNAPYPCIDLVGSRVHSVWQVGALKQYAAGQYVRYINILDLLIIYEHRVLGLEKYNSVPQNRTMTYVNYNYYMYQGGRGPTFMYNTQYRVCNPDNLLNSDTDAIWGLSHEWGHQHQMAPYFRWIGMAEVSNNIFSAYNVAHFGYPIATDPGRYPRNKWQSYINNKGEEVPGHIQQIFLNDNYNREITKPDKNGETKTANANDNIVMSLRSDAAKAAQNGNAFAWNKKLKNFAINQPKYPSKRFESDIKTYDDAQKTVNPRTALNAIEAYSSSNGELILGPYVNLMYYFEENGYPDLWPDFFESLRQNDNEHGSTIEKGKTEVDKYELLTSIFNYNKATGCDIDKIEQFKQMFPNSCWTTEGYIDGSNGAGFGWQQNSGPAIMNAVRKLSWLSGYNLWSFFERYGVFTVCAIEQGDYGIQYYIMTDDMYDEFKADMDDLEKQGILKPVSDEMMQKLTTIKATNCPKPNIPNDRPILPSDN